MNQFNPKIEEKIMKYVVVMMKYIVVICLVLVGFTQTATALTVSFSANPASVKQGQCVTLTWLSTNASKVSIDQGVGKVDPSGCKQVCPGKHYAIYDHRSR